MGARRARQAWAVAVKALTLAALVALGAGCGCANLKDTTHIATGVDAGSTVIGVTSGLAVEANPLIANPAIFVGVMLAQLAPWMPLLTAFFAAICAWNIVQIARMRH